MGNIVLVSEAFHGMTWQDKTQKEKRKAKIALRRDFRD